MLIILSSTLTYAPCQANWSVARGFCFCFTFSMYWDHYCSLHICGSVPSFQVLLKIYSSLCNTGYPRLTIISLVIASGPGDFFNFRFDSALVNSSYDKGEFITVDT